MESPFPVSFDTSSLRERIKQYQDVAQEIESYLGRHPEEWGRFQSQFNQEVNSIFRDLMRFEKESVEQGREDRVYKLKRLFIEWFRDDFIKGEYLEWSLKKPYGYPGDFKIIDDIYRNSPSSRGFVRLFDNYFQMCSICNAVRNRKEDFKSFVLNFLKDRTNSRTRTVRIMDLAAGPCRDVLEILSAPVAKERSVIFHCYDNDLRAIDYGKRLLQEDPRVDFFRQNAVRIALKKAPQEEIPVKYDFIYSTGLFDYLDTRVSIRLIRNLRHLLDEGGMLAVSDVRDKFSNPSIYFMEWVADWNLVYRDDDSFRSLFIEAGFSEKELSYHFEQQGIMQYVLASRRD